MSQLTKRAYARKHTLSYASFLYWFNKLAKPASADDFIPVSIKSEPEPPACLGFLEFPNGSRLFIHSPELLAGLPRLFD